MSNIIFTSSKYSIEYAKHHIRNFELEVSTFIKSNPYTRFVEVNADGTEDVHKVKLTKPMPPLLHGIAFDALNNLCSALDQAAYAVGIAAGNSGDAARFPFGETLAEVQSCHEGPSKDLPKSIFDLMMALQPYKGGNNLLWAMHKLCHSHKHKLVILVSTHAGAARVNHAQFGDFVGDLTLPPAWDSSKDEMVLFRTKHGSAFNYNLQLGLYIAFTGIEALARHPASAVLNRFAGITEGIVSTIEAETARLGLLVDS